MRHKRYIVFALIIMLLAGGLLSYKVVRHEIAQNSRITSLEKMGSDVGYLKEKNRQAEEYYEYQTNYTDDSFNYFAIGNSLTLIPSWGRGICSTRPDNDYFHLVIAALERQQHKDVVAYPFNFSIWERNGKRDSTLDLLDVYLSDKLDLVTIQLWENVVDKSTFEEDLEHLVAYVHTKAPKAKIIIVGDFWDREKDMLRKTAAEQTNSSFADLSSIRGKTEYQSVVNKECLLEDGSTIKVSKEAATHPGDEGMEYIADAILKAFNE